jgi:hypothetical protein
MIPPRTLDGDGFGNGVRFRVSACRRRLRVSRANHRPNVNTQPVDGCAEIETRSKPGRDNPSVVLVETGAQEEAEST